MPFVPPTDLIVRDAVEADLPAIVAIFNASVPGHTSNAELAPVTVESRREWFRSHLPNRRPLWVAEQKGEILAWVGLRDFLSRPAYFISAEVSLYVAPKSQGLGLGSWLLGKLLAECPRLGVENVISIVMAENHRSMRMFERLGFARWGHLPKVTNFHGVRRDVVIYGKAIAAKE